MMKITVNKKSGSLLAIVAALLALTGIFAFRDDGFHMNSAEIMFAQLMIPHHEQAITMSDLALKTSSNPEILALATQIKAAQLPEIAEMKSWLDKVKVGYAMNHDMGMNGMLSQDDLLTLKNSTGAKFDKLFLLGMIGHHQGAIEMALMVKNSSNRQIKILHDNVVRTQSGEVIRMNAILKVL
jgi:uncharacterized protein (DUF305 family)